VGRRLSEGERIKLTPPSRSRVAGAGEAGGGDRDRGIGSGGATVSRRTLGDEATMTQKASVVPFERIASAIWIVRGKKVMLDADLAALYGVETKALKRAVLRNRERFPEDFMFVLDAQEVANLRCQIGTSSSWGGLRYLPMAFTEQGVAMLSAVLRSPRAIAVSIAVVRAFVRLREFLASQATLGKRLRELERQVALHNRDMGTLFEPCNNSPPSGRRLLVPVHWRRGE